MSPPNPPQPVTPRERLLHVDIIRGIAVFGLIWVNLNPGFTPGPLTTVDVAARWTMSTFAAGKAFTLFSLLFGVTLAMQMERADRDSRPMALRWLRRMAVLYAIGWAHAVLFWPGDILRDYAIAGAVLIAFRRLSSRALVLVAVLALAVASNRESLSVVITRLVRGNVESVRRREEPTAEQVARRKAAGDAIRRGSYVDVVRTRMAVLPRETIRRASPPAGPLNWIVPWYLGVFLLGLVLGRHRIVQESEHHRRAIMTLLACGVAIGLPLNVYLAARPAWLTNNPLYSPLDITSKLTLALGYLAALLLLLQREEWLRRLRWLAPVGRLGLTNYIAQTAFLTFITFNYGLGLAPMWFGCLVIAAAFYVVQVAWSNWWVRRFPFGPVEWLWRHLTYGGVSRVQAPLAKAA